MKKLYAITLFFFAINSYSQNTTQGEYQYMTKGIKIQLENGLDMKKGYSLRDFSINHVDKYTFAFSLLVREGDKKTVAGIIVFAESKISGKNYLKAIPLGVSNQELSPLFSDYYSSIDEWDGRMTTAYSAALAKVITNFIMKPELINKIINHQQKEI